NLKALPPSPCHQSNHLPAKHLQPGNQTENDLSFTISMPALNKLSSDFAPSVLKPKKELRCFFCNKAWRSPKLLESHQEMCQRRAMKFKKKAVLKKVRSIIVKSRLVKPKKPKPPPKILPFQCPKCSDRFVSNQTLEMHMKFDHRPRPTCSNCQKVFDCKRKLLEHEHSEEDKLFIKQSLGVVDILCPNKVLTCDKCENYFTTADLLREHKHMVKKRNPLPLLITNKKEDVRTEKITFKVCVKNVPEVVINRVKLPPGDNNCPHCGKVFQNDARLHQHGMFCHAIHGRRKKPVSKSPKTDTVCSQCNVDFKTSKKLIKHTLFFHRVKTKSSSSKDISCKTCKKTFLSKNHYQKHFKQHGSPNICPLCTRFKHFETAEFLRWHVSLVHRKKYCFICRKTYLPQSTHKCKLPRLPKNRTTKNIIKEEPALQEDPTLELVTIPDDVKPVLTPYRDGSFPCTECEEKFTREIYLLEHLVSHTDLTPYKCEYCQKTFTDLTIFTSHLRTAHRPLDESSPYSLCSLKSHLKKELNIVNCQLCAQLFMGNEALEKHSKEQHPDLITNDQILFSFDRKGRKAISNYLVHVDCEIKLNGLKTEEENIEIRSSGPPLEKLLTIIETVDLVEPVGHSTSPQKELISENTDTEQEIISAEEIAQSFLLPLSIESEPVEEIEIPQDKPKGVSTRSTEVVTDDKTGILDKLKHLKKTRSKSLNCLSLKNEVVNIVDSDDDDADQEGETKQDQTTSETLPKASPSETQDQKTSETVPKASPSETQDQKTSETLPKASPSETQDQKTSETDQETSETVPKASPSEKQDLTNDQPQQCQSQKDQSTPDSISKTMSSSSETGDLYVNQPPQLQSEKNRSTSDLTAEANNLPFDIRESSHDEPLKRQRGRPPSQSDSTSPKKRAKRNRNQDKDCVADNVKISDEAKVVEYGLRRRKRLPEVITLSSDTEDERPITCVSMVTKSPGINDTSPKKKRGRPRKDSMNNSDRVLSPLVNDVVSPSSSDQKKLGSTRKSDATGGEETTRESDNNVVVIGKKKRGRPRKSETVGNTGDVPTKKKKKGRKRFFNLYPDEDEQLPSMVDMNRVPDLKAPNYVPDHSDHVNGFLHHDRLGTNGFLTDTIDCNSDVKKRRSLPMPILPAPTPLVKPTCLQRFDHQREPIQTKRNHVVDRNSGFAPIRKSDAFQLASYAQHDRLEKRVAALRQKKSPTSLPSTFQIQNPPTAQPTIQMIQPPIYPKCDKCNINFLDNEMLKRHMECHSLINSDGTNTPKNPHSNAQPPSHSNAQPPSHSNAQPSSHSNAQPSSHVSPQTNSRPSKSPCFLQESGIVLSANKISQPKTKPQFIDLSKELFESRVNKNRKSNSNSPPVVTNGSNSDKTNRRNSDSNVSTKSNDSPSMNKRKQTKPKPLKISQTTSPTESEYEHTNYEKDVEIPVVEIPSAANTKIKQDSSVQQSSEENPTKGSTEQNKSYNINIPSNDKQSNNFSEYPRTKPEINNNINRRRSTLKESNFPASKGHKPIPPSFCQPLPPPPFPPQIPFHLYPPAPGQFVEGVPFPQTMFPPLPMAVYYPPKHDEMNTFDA
uniref:C2H2-type domain-containing protein n=1 Tax=Clytia hemisphaerica TaxID=252671 RepID=A0A7M5UVX4_9CNID